MKKYFLKKKIIKFHVWNIKKKIVKKKNEKKFPINY